MRVLHVLPHRGGGAETYIELLERIPGSVHERFYLSRGRTPASGVASIPGRWRRLPARLRAAQLAHVQGDVASVLALPVLRVRPAILSTHGLHMLRRLDGPRRAVFARALAGAVHASRTVVCTSASELSEVSAVAAGRDRDKLQVIHNGIDPPAAVDGGRRAALRRELGAGPETIIGLFVGQLEPRKAPLLAARAAIRANAVDERFVLAVAGDGPQAAALEALRGEAVKVLGYRPDIHGLFGAADLFVQPSEREGMSLALLEAMGHGLPVVAADGPGNPEAVGDAGVLFPAGDEDALAAVLIGLSGDPARRRSLGEAARARALEHFGASRFIGAIEAVYREALAALTAPAPAAGGPRA